MLVSGSSGTGKNDMSYILNKLNFLGKTTFIENLIKSNRIDRKFKTIYYVYPYHLFEPPVNWDSEFEDVNVEFMNELPTIKFFETAEKSSVLAVLYDFPMESSLELIVWPSFLKILVL